MPIAQKRWLVTMLAFSIALSAFGLWLGNQFTPVRQIENWLTDLRVASFEVDKASLDIAVVMITITEDTLAKLQYRSPIDRAFLAETLAILDKANPRAVGLDVLLDQATEPSKDAILKRQLANMKAPLFVAWAGPDEGLTNKQSEFLDQFVPPHQRAIVNLIRDDGDGVVRQVKQTQPGETPSLSKALSGMESTKDAIYWVRKVNDTAEPAFPRYPADQLSLIPKQWLTDKLVLVGADLPTRDRHRTALNSLLGLKQGMRSGVEIHAQAVVNQLNGLGMNHLPLFAQAGVLWVLAFVGLLVGRGLSRAGWLLPMLLGITAGLIAIDQAMIAHWQTHMWLAVPVVITMLAMATGIGLSSRQHRAEKQFIKKAMSHYVAPEIVSDLQKNPERLSLGGKRQPLSMIFTDIEGFTALSESVPAELLVSHLNTYLDGVSQQITKHGGIVDKFIGDAVVALFNTPLPQPDHAAKAVTCALAIDAFSQSFQQKAKEAGLAWGETRIGVHSDDVIVGNMGGLQRFDYTAIGDGMNTAARLEGANKYLGTRICVSENTVSQLSPAQVESLGLRAVRKVKMQGKQNTVLVYTVDTANSDTTSGDTTPPIEDVLILGGK